MPAPRVESRAQRSTPADLQHLINTTAGTVESFPAAGCLSANARSRVIGLANTGGESVTVTVSPYLEAVGDTGNNIVSSALTIAANDVAYVTSTELPSIHEPWDSLSVSVNYATLPAGGTGVNVTVNERV